MTMQFQPTVVLQTERFSHFFQVLSLRLQDCFSDWSNFIADIDQINLEQNQFGKNCNKMISDQISRKDTFDENDKLKNSENQKEQNQKQLTIIQKNVNSFQELFQKQQNKQLTSLENFISSDDKIRLDSQSNQFQEEEAVIETSQISGQMYQQLLKQKNFRNQPSQLEFSQQNQQPMQDQFEKKQRNPSSVTLVKQFCQQLEDALQKKYQNEILQNQLPTLLVQILQNNLNYYIDEFFKKLKQIYFIKNGSKNALMSQTKTLSLTQFNLQLTMRSRQFKPSLNVEHLDSLAYSNATFFDINSQQNKEKQVTKRNSFTRLNFPKNDNQFDELQIDKTSSKGEVEINQKQFSETEILKQITQPKLNYSNNNNKNNTEEGILSSQRGRQSSEFSKEGEKRKIVKNNVQETSHQQVKIILQENNYEILPLTQKYKSPEKGPQINNFGLAVSQSKNKRSFSIRFLNEKPNHSRITYKNQGSVFSAEISQLQSRISRIKQEKILKKQKLEAQLRKVNEQIEQLQVEKEHNEQSKSSNSKKALQQPQKQRQNTLESRIKINDNLEQKLKALKLVKNLKAEKAFRQNHRRQNNKQFNADIHNQIEQIMKLKYFNQQRVKQKRQLEIIERMKQQQMRKILQQKQKQQSVQFLVKLKNSPLEKQDKTSKFVKEKLKKSFQTPIIKKPQSNETKEPTSNPAFEKKKAYINKIKNFTIVKKQKEDIYEQTLD